MDHKLTDYEREYFPPRIKKKFSPEQPRDEWGRWTDSGKVPRTVVAEIHETRQEPGIMQSIRDTGGFSFSVRVSRFKKIGVDTGYMVSPYPERGEVFKERVTRDDIRKFIKKNEDLLLKPGHYVGGWIKTDTGETFIDVSICEEDLEKAHALGRKHNQIALFDLKNGVEIPVKKEGDDGKEKSRQGSRFDYRRQSNRR